MTNDRHDELDSILDAALSEYSNSGPRPGFEHRILRGVHAVPPVRHFFRRLGWALAPVSMAVVALSLVLLFHGSPQPRPLPQTAYDTQLPVQPLPLPRVPVIARVVSSRNKLPKLERFPEAEPPTPGELALLRFARSEPEQARELVADLAQMKDLTIDPLKIDALP